MAINHIWFSSVIANQDIFEQENLYIIDNYSNDIYLLSRYFFRLCECLRNRIKIY